MNMQIFNLSGIYLVYLEAIPKGKLYTYTLKSRFYFRFFFRALLYLLTFLFHNPRSHDFFVSTPLRILPPSKLPF